MAKRLKIPLAALPDIEANRLATWQDRDNCRQFPVCMGDGEACNPECAVPQMRAERAQTFGDGGQWGAL